MDSYAYSEVTRSCQQVGCARNRLQFHTVLQKLKQFLSKQVHAWMEFQLFIFRIWLQKCSILPQTNSTTPKIKDREAKKPNQCSNPARQFDLSDVHDVSSNAKFSRFGAMLFVFEDNEAVIKMIIKGRSPTMRHVSRTHRVALEWLSERINLDPKIQIKYVDTKHQFADILKERNLTRDDWTNLLRLFNISHFSLLCCSQNFILTSCIETMAKRMQEQEGEGRIVAKSKPTMNPTFTVSTSSSTVQIPIASKSPRDTQSTLSNILVKYRET